MLPLGQHLALASPWWSWDCAGVRKALWSAVLVRLRRLGNERLKANGAAGRLPGGWRDLEFLRREAKTHRRVFDGKTNLCPELLLGYASVLGLDAQACFPETESWVAEAAAYLARYGTGRVREVADADARAYAAHVLPYPSAGIRTAADVLQRLDGLPRDVRSAVAAVADALGPVLEGCDPEARAVAGGRSG